MVMSENANLVDRIWRNASKPTQVETRPTDIGKESSNDERDRRENKDTDTDLEKRVSKGRLIRINGSR